MTTLSSDVPAIAITADLIHGAVEHEQTEVGLLPHRIPAWARQQAADPQLSMAEAQPAGVRVAVDTAASVIELRAAARRVAYRGLPARPDGIFEAVVDGVVVDSAFLTEATTTLIDPVTGETTVDEKPAQALRFDLTGASDENSSGQSGSRADAARERRVEIWLPHTETIELVDLRADAPMRPTRDDRPVWVHHGSSISHGSNARRPTATWPVAAAGALDLNLVNLGLGGSCMLDPCVARSIRDAPADRISVKIGINLVNADLMRMRAFRTAVHGFLDTIRDGHPTAPLLVISPIQCPIHEETPGPGDFDPEAMARGEMRFIATGDPAAVKDGALTLATIRDELARIVAERAEQDPHLSYLDGRDLYGPDDVAEHPMPDNLHPDAATHVLMAERFAAAGWPA